MNSPVFALSYLTANGFGVVNLVSVCAQVVRTVVRVLTNNAVGSANIPGLVLLMVPWNRKFQNIDVVACHDVFHNEPAIDYLGGINSIFCMQL